MLFFKSGCKTESSSGLTLSIWSMSCFSRYDRVTTLPSKSTSALKRTLLSPMSVAFTSWMALPRETRRGETSVETDPARRGSDPGSYGEPEWVSPDGGVVLQELRELLHPFGLYGASQQGLRVGVDEEGGDGAQQRAHAQGAQAVVVRVTWETRRHGGWAAETDTRQSGTSEGPEIRGKATETRGRAS